MPESREWTHRPSGFRRSEVSVSLGSGEALWRRAVSDVLLWKVKTRSGFRVDSNEPVAQGQGVLVTASALGFTVVEPVEVVTVVSLPDRVGFAYRTLPGHPVNGEEAFIVHRRGDEVVLTIRSLTRAASEQLWRLLFPALLLMQRVVRRRYLRSLI
ncbi:DUF1990 family protein [Arthrobacter psychrolactophilus]